MHIYEIKLILSCFKGKPENVIKGIPSVREMLDYITLFVQMFNIQRNNWSPMVTKV